MGDADCLARTRRGRGIQYRSVLLVEHFVRAFCHVVAVDFEHAGGELDTQSVCLVRTRINLDLEGMRCHMYTPPLILS